MDKDKGQASENSRQSSKPDVEGAEKQVGGMFVGTWSEMEEAVAASEKGEVDLGSGFIIDCETLDKLNSHNELQGTGEYYRRFPAGFKIKYVTNIMSSWLDSFNRANTLEGLDWVSAMLQGEVEKLQDETHMLLSGDEKDMREAARIAVQTPEYREEFIEWMREQIPRVREQNERLIRYAKELQERIDRRKTELHTEQERTKAERQSRSIEEVAGEFLQTLEKNGEKMIWPAEYGGASGLAYFIDQIFNDDSRRWAKWATRFDSVKPHDLSSRASLFRNKERRPPQSVIELVERIRQSADKNLT